MDNVEQEFRHSLSKHQILKAILKYNNHSSITIKRYYQGLSGFYFSQVDKKVKFLKTPKFYKGVQETDPHAKIIKEDADYFTE